MIIAWNLTVAAFVKDAALMIKGGLSRFEAKDIGDFKDLVTQTFAAILTNLEKQALGKELKLRADGLLACSERVFSR